ncbi:MAG: DUF2203 family protein, partial [Gemmatimonadales bacterium]
MTATKTDRIFRQDEASATLPLVSQIVADIQQDNGEFEVVLPQLKDARIRSRQEGTSVPQLEQLRHEVAEITTRFERYLEELDQIGCVYRGTAGHVDFRSEEGGRPVFLCWSPDETTVEWSHPIGLDCRFRSPIENHVVLPVSG